MKAFIHHFTFEFLAGIRNKQLLLLNYLFPLGFYLMMGFIMVEINPSFQENVIPAMVIFGVLSATLLGIPDPLVNARENGIYRSYKINGIPAISILIIPAFTTILHLLIVAVVITSTASWLFNAPLPIHWFNFSVVFFAGAIACAGLSVLIGVVSPNSRMTILWSQLVFTPSMLLGGLMIPFSMLPEAAQKIAQLLPSTQAMNAFNGLAMGKIADFSPWGSVLVLFSGGLLAFGLAVYLFSWDSRNSTRRGHPLLGLLALLPYVIQILFSL
ncbi:MAG: ABC transporter permease [Anaerolineales bacterium]